MEQLEFFPVPSPCVGVCSTDDKGYCEGCMRKRDERFNWLSLSPAQQRHIMKLCQQRYYRKRLAERKQVPKEQSNQESNFTQQDLF